MPRTGYPRVAVLAVAAGLTAALAACGPGGSSGSAAAAASSSAAARATSAAISSATAGPFGSRCAQFPDSGPGSFAAMKSVPFATAISGNPLLSTLSKAITDANLTDSLNSLQNITVLAPADSAFQALSPDRLKALLSDVPKLTATLTHHVLPGRLTPEQLNGTHTTLDNDRVKIEGSGEDFSLSGDETLTHAPASVVCGNVQTANATIYVIDQVLEPEKTG